MDKMSAPSSRELAQRLYDKNIELENRRRKSAQARIPSDPNAWQLMRENYEAIILEDHAFSEQHNIEYALWQLHYRRIEELRAHFSAALASSGSATSQSAKGPLRPDRVAKIRLQFKNFLSEATGFYHELILKIRAKYGLPLGNFSEDSENQIVMEKDVKKSTEMKKGLISCHRCLIYLGDLARYKGLYGEGDSKTRDYAAASSYYLQAASLWPSSGNPHHQLAILASYSGDELVAVYRYFRSLAVDSPFSTARDNLIVAFEKNRQNFSQLLGDAKASAVKESPVRMTAKGRGKGEAKLPSKDSNMETSIVKGTASSIHETYKTFCIRFVRLNGILFTRTSLETFAEVLSLVSSSLNELLSSGLEEEMNFGKDAVENGLVIVRLISILIFTVHNVNRETEGQTYAEILQRTVLLQNAFTAVFEFMGHILKRCVQICDSSSSYLLPGILVFVEWLACCPDVAVGNDVEEKQGTVRLVFWNHCISFLNKLFRYEEGETENRLALWEDFELRGFLPLVPAQTILDFSRKHSYGNKTMNLGIMQPKAPNVEGEEEDEVIVFKPTVNEKRTDVIGLTQSPHQGLEPDQNASARELQFYGGSVSAPLNNLHQLTALDASSQPLVSVANIVPQHLQQLLPRASNWFVEEGASVANGLRSLSFLENGHQMKPGIQEDAIVSYPASLPLPIQPYANLDAHGMFYGRTKPLESIIPSKIGSIASAGLNADCLIVKTSSDLPASSRKTPVSRPARHLGPPPGFSSVPSKQGLTVPSIIHLMQALNLLVTAIPWQGRLLFPSLENKFQQHRSKWKNRKHGKISNLNISNLLHCQINIRDSLCGQVVISCEIILRAQMVLEHGSRDRPAFCWYQIWNSNVAALSMLLSLCWRMVCWHLAGVCY
ncbi:unnamed protein product, partial [Vitis vinifera]